MKVIKRHKGLALVGGLTLILLVVLFIVFARMIFMRNGSNYGNRLDGIVKIDNKINNSIVSDMKENEVVEDFNVRIQGKIIYVVGYFKEGTSKNTAKDIANKVLEYYDEDVLECYDIEFLFKENVTQSEDSEKTKTGFIMAGTKHPEIESISWTK